MTTYFLDDKSFLYIRKPKIFFGKSLDKGRENDFLRKHLSIEFRPYLLVVISNDLAVKIQTDCSEIIHKKSPTV